MSRAHAHAHKQAGEPMPPGIHNVYLFDGFNTTSWLVVLGSPMLLFLQHLDATATIIAVAVSLSPLLNILQIPAARFVEQVGYRRFVIGGWSSRSLLVVGMAVVAFLPESVDRTTRIVLMLFLLFIFNILRGISVCGMLPWFTHIVPESRRGEFLARDQSAVAFSSVVSLLLFGAVLTRPLEWHPFGSLFVISFVAAWISLIFLRRVPDVPVEKIVRNRQRIPWLEILFHPPFFRYLRYNIIINIAMGLSGAFWVRFVKTLLHASNWNVLFIAATTNLVLAFSLLLIASMIDRTGNKQVLTLSGVLLVLHFTGWACVASGLVSFHDHFWVVVAVQALTSGFGVALWNLANVRMVMGIVPAMGRPHFLALYSVCANVTFGSVPLVAGPVIDYLDAHEWQDHWGAWNWNPYSLLYCLLTSTIIVGLCVLQTLNEPHKMTWDVFMRELLVRTPGRALSRVITRLRGPSIG